MRSRPHEARTRLAQRAILAVLVLTILGPPAGPGATQLDTDTERAATEALVAMEKQGFVGSVLVGRNGAVVYARDFGFDTAELGVPSYWIASISKQFTAAAILKLQEQGKLDIDASIAKVLPGVRKDRARITLFQLLTHTSGIPQTYAADGIADRSLALDALLATKPVSPPGEQFNYANDNYNLLAIIVEVVSGQTFEEFMRGQVTDPAGMKHVGFWGEPVDGGDLVPPVITPVGQRAMKPNWGFRGATGMRASVPDLYAWVQSLELGEVLSRASVELLMGSHVTRPSGTEIGFNWFAATTDAGIPMRFTRGTESFGGNAVVYQYPRHGLTIITATNAGPAETGAGPVEGWSRKTHRALAEIFLAEAE